MIGGLFSPGADVFAATLLPSGPTGVRSFPKELGRCSDAELRIQDGEAPGAWLVRMARRLEHGDLGRCRLDEGLAAIGRVRWRDGLTIESLACQFIISSASQLEEVEDWPAVYLRLDFDLRNLGPMFAEPLPHLHVREQHVRAWTGVAPSPKVPRFEFRGLVPRSPLGGILDFVYRNFFFDSWFDWATRVGLRACGSAGHAEEAIFEVRRAFETNSAECLGTQYRALLLSLKRAWAAELEKANPLVLPLESARLLSMEDWSQ